MEQKTISDLMKTCVVALVMSFGVIGCGSDPTGEYVGTGVVTVDDFYSGEDPQARLYISELDNSDFFAGQIQLGGETMNGEFEFEDDKLIARSLSYNYIMDIDMAGAALGAGAAQPGSNPGGSLQEISQQMGAGPFPKIFQQGHRGAPHAGNSAELAAQCRISLSGDVSIKHAEEASGVLHGESYVCDSKIRIDLIDMRRINEDED